MLTIRMDFNSILNAELLKQVMQKEQDLQPSLRKIGVSQVGVGVVGRAM